MAIANRIYNYGISNYTSHSPCSTLQSPPSMLHAPNYPFQAPQCNRLFIILAPPFTYVIAQYYRAGITYQKVIGVGVGNENRAANLLRIAARLLFIGF